MAELLERYDKMTIKLEDKSSDDLERRLWIASRQYMRGEISMEDLENVERPHSEKLRNAVFALAEQREKWDPNTRRRVRKRRRRFFRAVVHVYAYVMSLFCL